MISKFIEKRMLNMLDEWYSAMSKRKMNHVCTLKEKIDQHLSKDQKEHKTLDALSIVSGPPSAAF